MVCVGATRAQASPHGRYRGAHWTAPSPAPLIAARVAPRPRPSRLESPRVCAAACVLLAACVCRERVLIATDLVLQLGQPG